MSDHRGIEHEIRSALDENAPFKAPNHLLQSFEFNARRTRRYPRWLALVKEPTMRTDNHLAVGSPTARVAAIVVAMLLATLLVVSAGIAGAQLFAAGGPIVVDQSGNGDYITIAEAVAAAEDGDEVIVMPGTYLESVTVDKGISIRGDDRDAVVIEFGHDCTFVENTFQEPTTCPDGTPMYDGPSYLPTPYGIVLDGVDAEISDLTFNSIVNGTAIAARGGAPSIHDVTMRAETAWGGDILVHDGSEAVISDSDLGVGWVFIEEQSPATVERSSFWGIVANTNNTPRTGGPSTIRDNHAVGILFKGPATVTGNTVAAPDGEEVADDHYGQGIDVQPGNGWLIADNTVTGFTGGTAIQVDSGAAGTISGNVLEGNESGIRAGANGSRIEGNTVVDGGTGVGIGVAGGHHELVGNVVEGGEGLGISLGIGTTATLSGNRSCGNLENLSVIEGVEPEIDDTNEICEDESPE